MSDYIYFANGGSGNHGCEAIVRSLEGILSPEHRSLSLSISYDQDLKYGLRELVDVYSLSGLSKNNFSYLRSYLDLKFRKSKYSLDLFPYHYVLSKIRRIDQSLALSIGGDNYCYGGYDFYYELDRLFHRKGIKTAMVGCSIDPDILSDSIVHQDLESHSLIIARESLSYNAMRQIGLQNVILLPDPAFLLRTETGKANDIITDNTVGINLSPLVDKCSRDGKIVSRNADKLLAHIIETTDMQIALIPHVVWPQSNDFDTLRPLYEKYKDTGRVILIDDCNAEELKGYISRCRFLIAARTHASIAAYSTCVPTLVIGYSVKSKGIAKDIFGTFDNYVIAAQDFKTDSDLIDRFEWLRENENPIRDRLKSFMPDYCKKAYEIRKEIERIC